MRPRELILFCVPFVLASIAVGIILMLGNCPNLSTFARQTPTPGAVAGKTGDSLATPEEERHPAAKAADLITNGPGSTASANATTNTNGVSQLTDNQFYTQLLRRLKEGQLHVDGPFTNEELRSIITAAPTLRPIEDDAFRWQMHHITDIQQRGGEVSSIAREKDGSVYVTLKRGGMFASFDIVRTNGTWFISKIIRVGWS